MIIFEGELKLRGGEGDNAVIYWKRFLLVIVTTATGF